MNGEMLFMKLQLIFLVFIYICGMGPSLVAGEIYQWIDEDGVQHFTNLPPPPGAQIVEGLSETPSDKKPAGTGPTKRKDKGAVKAGENNSTDGGDTRTVESGDRRFRKWKNSPTDRGESGAVKTGENGSTDGGDTGTVESRDGRFRKWNNSPTDREETDAVGGDENNPTDREIN